jgi:hypothetical protein
MNTKKLRFKNEYMHFIQGKCFDVYGKKGRCFSPSAQKTHEFRPQQSNSYMEGMIKLYYKVWTNMYNIEFNS